MSISKTREKVRDGYLGDLPEAIQTKVMNIHKLIKDTVHDLLDDPNYEDLKSSNWAMPCIDEFCVMPKDKSEVGSVRVYKNGKTYRCMIQATGHFRNHQYGWIEELLHDFIKNVYATIRPKVRRKYDMTITNEGRTGEPYEGFDIYPNPKLVKDIWEMFDDKKTKTITEGFFNFGKPKKQEGKVTIENMNITGDDLNDIPKDLADYLTAINREAIKGVQVISKSQEFNDLLSADDVNTLISNINKKINIELTHIIGNDTQPDGYEALITVCTGAFFNSENEKPALNCIDTSDKRYKYEDFVSDVMKYAEKSVSNKPSYVDDVELDIGFLGFNIVTTYEFQENLWHHVRDRRNQTYADASEEIHEYYQHYSNMSYDDYIYEKSHGKLKHDPNRILFENTGNVWDIKNNPDLYKKESASPEYNVDMSEAEAKKTLRTLSQSIINDTANKKEYKMSQYTANIYANIITKNLLPIWAKGFRKFSITLDNYQSFNTFEFKVPNMTQDFVSRFVNGRESINGFVHRNAEIKVKMSPRIFHSMKNPDDAYRFFKAAIKYYDSGLEKACLKMMAEVMKLNTEMKHLISTTKLSGIVTYPMTLLFVFNNVSMNDIDTFRITNDDITTVNKFIRSIYTRYASPEKEKKLIIEDLHELVKSLKESCDPTDENIHDLTHFPEAVEKYLFGGFDSEMAVAKERWVYEQIDHEWSKQQTGQLKYIKEAFGVKKLKKIPADLVAYISIEAESIRDANDKMMISSYCLGKIEIVEWYIELLEVGSKKYIVPHTKPYLQSVRTQLLACFKKIMDTPIPKADRPLLDINYPKGYEG